MAIAELPQGIPSVSEVVGRDDGTSATLAAARSEPDGTSAALAAAWSEPGDVDVRLDVHDASRLEWSVSIPLPERGQLPYAIDLELEIPANVFARHLPWDQLQSWTRLDAAADSLPPGETPSIDALRRGAVAFAHRLGRASEDFARHCRSAGAVSGGGSHPSPFDRAPTPHSLEVDLLRWVTFVAVASEEARGRLTKRAPRDSAEI